MQLAHKRFHLGVFGGSGNGKTEYGLRFVAHARATCAFLFDEEGQFAERMELQPARTIFELDQALTTGWVCFDPHILFPGNLEEGLVFFTHYAHEAAKLMPGRKFLVVDELQRYVTGHKVPWHLKNALQSGRRAGLDCVIISTQPNEIHNTILGQLSEVVCFQMTVDAALDFPIKFGFNADEVRALRPYQFICRNNQGGEFRG